MLYIGIDLGTSAVKLLLMDEAGQIKNVVSRASSPTVMTCPAVRGWRRCPSERYHSPGAAG